jgi:GTP-binding protein
MSTMIRCGSHLRRSLPRQITASARALSVVGNGGVQVASSASCVDQPHSTQTRWLSSHSSSTGIGGSTFKSSLLRVNAKRILNESRLSIRFKSAVASESLPYTPARRAGVRNVAIIAHVDHGKTTLVDQLLRASTSDSTTSASVDRLLDSGDLEKERGITITSKVTRCQYDDTIFNVVDTPGHADFCGEVDRILSLVDGVCLVVDAGEGPMAQTKYVLSRALSLGLKPLVVLNKADRAEALGRIESGETESTLLDLFDNLGATDEQMDYVTLYASARDGWVTPDPSVASQIAAAGSAEGIADVSMKVLLDHFLKVIPEPAVRSYQNAETSKALDGESFKNDTFSLAAVLVGNDKYLGRTCTGRIYSGSVSINDEVVVVKRIPEDKNGNNDDSTSTGGTMSQPSTLGGMFVNRGISRTPLEPAVAYAGDIVTLAGVPDSIAVGDTVTGASDPVEYPIETPPLVPPTLSMEFGANSGPLAGTEGTVVTASKVRDRLIQETDNNVTINVTKSESDSDKTIVFARGELQLGILIEQMRREGFELVIAPPRILTRECPDTGKTLEPFEEATVDVDTEYAGTIVSMLTGDRKAILLEMNESSADGKTRLIFEIPSRGLLGFNSEVATATRGSAIVNHVYIEDRLYAGALGSGGARGKLISSEAGKATTYALSSLIARGTLFVGAGDIVYPGMVIGESAKVGDLEVNPVRAKALTNMRTVNKDEKVFLPPPKKMTVEELIGYMSPDEMIEVTPKGVRLRKAQLDPTQRRKDSRVKKQQQDALNRK